MNQTERAPLLSFEAFQKTAIMFTDLKEMANHAVNLGDIYSFHFDRPIALFVYEGGLHFIKRKDGQYYCILGTEDILSRSFSEVERELYQYYLIC